MATTRPAGGSVRNKARTRARILAKATRLFAKHGFEGTTTAQIVAAAGTNRRMPFYYFGDKRGLYRAVFVAQWTELKESFDGSMQARLESGAPPDAREMLRLVLGTLFDFMASHRDLVRLMMWEGLEGGGISRSIWQEIRGPLFEQAVAVVGQCKVEGVLDPDVDPAQYIVSFLGAVNFYFAYAHTMTDMIGLRPMSPEALAHRKQQVLALQEQQFLASELRRSA